MCGVVGVCRVGWLLILAVKDCLLVTGNGCFLQLYSAVLQWIEIVLKCEFGFVQLEFCTERKTIWAFVVCIREEQTARAVRSLAWNTESLFLSSGWDWRSFHKVFAKWGLFHSFYFICDCMVCLFSGCNQQTLSDLCSFLWELGNRMKCSEMPE